MKLGIISNTNRNLDHLIGLTRAAIKKGHEVMIFSMDDGTELAESSRFKVLCRLDNVTISICRHSAEEHKVQIENIPREIVCGSQFNNAVMIGEADKVLVL